jgi:hypothetical protein
LKEVFKKILTENFILLQSSFGTQKNQRESFQFFQAKDFAAYVIHHAESRDL